MIVQAIVALLQQAPAIDRATVRSCFLYRAAADNFFSGFRRLQCHAAEKSGDPSSVFLSTLAALSAAFFFAARVAREAGEKISQRADRRHAEGSTVVTCCLIIRTAVAILPGISIAAR